MEKLAKPHQLAKPSPEKDTGPQHYTSFTPKSERNQIMIVNLNALTKAIEVLNNETDPDLHSLSDALLYIQKDTLTDRRDSVDLMDRDHAIATALWYEMDIQNHLQENNYPPTEENINAVLDELDTDNMEGQMIAAGWEFISNAFDEADNKHKLQK